MKRLRHMLRSVLDHIRFFQIGLAARPRLFVFTWALLMLGSFLLTQSRGPSAWGLGGVIVGVIGLPLLQILKNHFLAGPSAKVVFETPEGILDDIETAQQLASDRPEGMQIIPRGSNPAPIMHAPEFDKALRETGHDWEITRVEHSAAYARVIADLRMAAPQWRGYGQRLFLKKLFSKQPLTNESKILFESPLSLANDHVTLGKTDYFAAVCTADLSIKTGYRTQGHHDPVLPARTRWGYRESNGQLFAPALVDGVVPMSLHLGVDVVIMTRDGVLPLAIQGADNLQSPNATLPFASGSMDWEDIGDATHLSQVILQAARRELNEEWGGPLANGAASQACRGADLKVVGMYREMNRGGKPQFVVGGRVDLDYCNLVPEQSEVVRSTCAEAAPLITDLQAMDDFATMLVSKGLEVLPKRSQALFGAFHCLQNAIRTSPDFVADLYRVSKK